MVGKIRRNKDMLVTNNYNFFKYTELVLNTPVLPLNFEYCNSSSFEYII